MKKTNKVYYLSIIFLLLSFLVSCVHEDAILEDKDKGLIIMSLDNIKTRGGALFDDDKQINNVRILVFTNQTLDINKLFKEGEDSFKNPFVLEVTTGVKEIYVIANETTDLHYETITTKSELMEAMAKEINAPLNQSQPIIMTGKVSNVQVQSNQQNQVNVTLVRIAAKIKLSLKKDVTDKIEINKISLLNNTRKTLIYEGNVSGQSYWNYTNQLLTPHNLATELNLGPIYLYENLSGSGDKGHALKLEIEATYNDIPTVYRVYVNENITAPGSGIPGDPISSITTPNDHLYQIKRNHQYTLKGTIKGLGQVDGLHLQVEVLPWDLIKSVQEFNEEPILITTTFESSEVVTTMDNPLSFQFTMNSGPEGATWKASLDNGLEFEFEDITQTYGGLNETKTITIKPKKAYHSAPERSTHFFIMVTDPQNKITKRIPLIGTATEILITQKP